MSNGCRRLHSCSFSLPHPLSSYAVQSGGQQREQRRRATIPIGIWRQARPGQRPFLRLLPQRCPSARALPPCSSQHARQKKKKRKKKEKEEKPWVLRSPSEERDPSILRQHFLAAGFFRSNKVKTPVCFCTLYI